jgi:hypothetical protein
MKKPTEDEAIKCTNLLGEIAQSIQSLSETELDDQIKMSGRDPKKVVANTRVTIERLIAESNRSKLRDARQALNAARRVSPPAQRSAIPHDPALQRQLLDRLAAQSNRIPQRLTMAFRDRTNLSSSDLESMLRDLERLGLLSDLL